jgi:hypothetical protein
LARHVGRRAMSFVHIAHECEVIGQRYVCGDLDRDDAHNQLVEAGLLDVEAADLLDVLDAQNEGLKP